MANDVVANAGSGGATFNATNITAFTALSTAGVIPGAILYVGANATTQPTGVTDAHPLPVTVRSSGGTEITVFPVSAASLPLPSGAATAANQSTGNSSLSSIDGKIAACNTGAVVVSTSALPTGAATAANQSTGNSSLSSIDGKITACNTGAVVVSSSALPSGAATAAKQPAIGTAGSPSADVVSVQGVAGGTAIPVSQSGTWTVGISAAQTLATVTTVGTVTNLSQMGGTAIAMGTGVRTAGTQRVTIATDDVVPASQSGTWTVILGAGTAGVGKLTSNSGVTIGAVELAASQTLGTVTTVGTVTAVTTVSTLTSLTGGGVAHDGVDSGNPIKIGGRAVTSLATATMVGAGDRTDAVYDVDGAMIVRLNRPGADGISERVTDTSGTSTAFANFGAVASTRNIVTAIAVYNSSATAGFVDFRDGTGGAVLWTMPLPAGGGAVLSSANPLFRTSANTPLAYDVSGALSTVYISISGFQSKV